MRCVAVSDPLPGMPEEAKRCSGCKLVKPLTDFNRRRTATDGRQGYCRDCFAAWHNVALVERVDLDDPGVQ